jgi:IclR family KDG regulon transcriptional repressor
MVSSLEKFNYISRKATASETLYTLGLTFLEKANIVSEQLDIRELAREEMVNLRNRTGLTVQLAIKEGSDAVYIEQIESLREIRIFPSVGKRVPLYVAACPRILLTYLPLDEQDELVNDFHYVSFTSKTKTTPSEVREAIEQIKCNGYEISEGELYEGTIAVAAPIKDRTGLTIASLSITGLKSDFAGENQKSNIEKLISSAMKICAQLGYESKA